VFVVTDLVDQGRPPAHERLHALLVSLTASGKSLDRILLHHKLPQSVGSDAFAATRHLLRTVPHQDIENLIDGLQNETVLDAAWDADVRPLTWTMLREMRAAGMTIGSHSKTHAFLCNESEQRVHAEAAESRNALDKNLGIRADWFAYPGGSFNRTVVRAVAAAGYRFAFTDCAHRDRAFPQLTLPRKTMWERSCLDPRDRFAPEILSCHSAALFEPFSGCARAH